MKCLESWCSSRTIRWVGLVVGCLNIAVSGAVLAANAFIGDLKEVFNLTQSNTELTVAVGQIGSSLGPPAGLVFVRYGPTVSFMSALVLGTGACLLLVSTTYSIPFYHDNFWLMSIYIFTYGYSAIVMYLTAGTVSMTNFKRRHRGKVVAITGASWFAGPAVFSVIYNELFAEKNNLRGFFLVLAIVMFVVNLLAAIFVKDYSHLVGELLDDENELVLESDGSEKERQKRENWKNVIGLNLCSSLDFHLLSWAFFLSAGTQLMLINNVVIYLESYKWTSYTTALLVTGPVAAATTKIVTGFLSDHFISSIPRTAWIAVATFGQTILTFASINNGGNAGLFVATVLVFYICNAFYFSLFPAFLSEIFGMRYFSRNWGGLVLAMAFVTLGLMTVFGVLYDRQAGDTSKCFGEKCFRESLIISSILSSVALLLISIMAWRERRWRATK